MFKYINLNPQNKNVGDCTVRALSIAEGIGWKEAYIDLCIQGFINSDMPSSNEVMEVLLKSKGYIKEIIKTDCYNCYTVEDFCREHPDGIYILATGTHVIAVIDGDYYDSWNSKDKIPIYYYKKIERR